MSLADLRKLLDKAQGNKKKAVPYDSVLVKVSGIYLVAQVEKEIKAMGYSTESMESIRKPMEKEARQKQMMLGGLGAISLFVAALGITNTMIMSISERTREIGIMKALGCYVTDIRVHVPLRGRRHRPHRRRHRLHHQLHRIGCHQSGVPGAIGGEPAARHFGR